MTLVLPQLVADVNIPAPAHLRFVSVWIILGLMKYFRSKFVCLRGREKQSTTPKLKASVQTVIGRLKAFLRENRSGGDPIFADQANYRLLSIAQQLEEFLHGKLSFGSTETWRSVYEDLLANCPEKRYLSVALLESEDYWRDKPGDRSLELNYRLLAEGFFIHRLFVIDDFFWPPGSKKPSGDIFPWIHQQYQRGIEVTLLRLSELSEELDLVCDMGIYGNRAVGYQITDQSGRTTRFELHFDPDSVRLALEHWKKLQLYAISLQRLLDHAEE